LLDDEPRLVDATNAFRAAREITTASGIVKDVDDLLISLAEVEPSRAFAQIREAATGKTSQPA
jgi:hypothetical protein